MWAFASGLRPWSRIAFGRALRTRFKRHRENGGFFYTGLALKKSAGSSIEKARVPGAVSWAAGARAPGWMACRPEAPGDPPTRPGGGPACWLTPLRPGPAVQPLRMASSGSAGERQAAAARHARSDSVPFVPREGRSRHLPVPTGAQPIAEQWAPSPAIASPDGSVQPRLPPSPLPQCTLVSSGWRQRASQDALFPANWPRRARVRSGRLRAGALPRDLPRVLRFEPRRPGVGAQHLGAVRPRAGTRS